MSARPEPDEPTEVTRAWSVGESDAWATTLLDAVAVVIVDRERRVQGWNRRATRHFGYDPDVTVGRDLLEVAPFDDPDGLGAAARKRLRPHEDRRRVSVHAFAPADPEDGFADDAPDHGIIVIVHDDPHEATHEDEGPAALRHQLGREWALLEAVLNQMPIGLTVAEAASGGQVLHNENAVRLLGTSVVSLPTEGVLTGLERLDGTPYHVDDLPLLRALRGEEVRQEDVTYRRPDGSLVHFAVNAAPVRDAAGATRAAVATFDDVSERRSAQAALEEKIFALRTAEKELARANERLRVDALHDALTRLPNRLLFMDRLEQVLHRRKEQPDRDAAVLFLDFDRFKIVNDSLGHAVGDAMLVALAGILTHLVRAEDTVARLGGDEFVILLDHVDSPARAEELAERIRASLEDPLSLEGQFIYTSASIGVVPSLRGYDAAEAVLRDADTAMYDAKAKGPGRHQVFDGSMRAEVLATLELETALRRALERDEFRVVYGSIHRLDTRELVGFEALVRWEHPQRGLLRPDAFLPVAQEMGIVRRIDHLVWREAARTVASWRARFDRRLWLSLNFSRQHLLAPNPDEELIAILEEAGADLDQTVIELAQGALSEVPDDVATSLMKLVARGVHVHLDDFGTGHSSLSNLQRFRVGALKLDASLVAGMTEDRRCRDLVEAITAMAGGLDVQVLAEGVETEAQRARLRGLGCTYAQGHLFSAPLDAEAAARVLEAARETNGADRS